jgi:ATP-dependent Clp protease protease subunit
MAAVLVTLAEHSYALPDAIMVHHQVWGISFGNRVEQAEQLKVMNEWSERLMKPVAEKMGLTLPKLVEKMYEHNSHGEWSEFATEAVKHKWVEHVVEEIRDTSYTKLPVEEETEAEAEEIFFSATNREQVDDQGRRYIKVPHLRPMDVYHLYNPDNYYRY